MLLQRITKYRRTACLLFLLGFIMNSANSQDKKYSAGIALGYIPASDASVYLGRDINQWVDREPSLIFEINAGYRISDFFKAGVYFEKENAKLKLVNSEQETINRWAVGMQWMGNYPNYFIQWQFGGYTGFGLANYSVDNVGFSGLDYGIITGPAYEKDKLGVAFHLHAGFVTYSGSDIPEEFSMHDLRLFLKLYYIF